MSCEAPHMAWFMDLGLSRRLERTEGAIGASFPAVHQLMAPDVGATWQDFEGTYAIFDGVDSPMTQTFGLGVFGATTPGGLSAIEAFFETRDAAAMHEVSPLAGIDTIALLVDRGYRPLELSTVLVQEIDGQVSAPSSPALRVRTIDDADRSAWIETSVIGWSEDPAVAAFIRS